MVQGLKQIGARPALEEEGAQEFHELTGRIRAHVGGAIALEELHQVLRVLSGPGGEGREIGGELLGAEVGRDVERSRAADVFHISAS